MKFFKKILKKITRFYISNSDKGRHLGLEVVEREVKGLANHAPFFNGYCFVFQFLNENKL